MRRVDGTEHEKIMRYIVTEPAYNTYIIGDIEQLGYDNDALSFYVVDEGGGYDCLLMKYLDNCVLYSHHDGYDAGRVAAFLTENPSKGCISGKENVLAKLAPLFPQKTVRNTHLAVIEHITSAAESKEDGIVLKLSARNARELLSLYLEIDEFSHKYKRAGDKELEEIRYQFKSGRTYGVWRNGRLAAAASSTAENRITAMITNVATHPAHRGRGLATRILLRLCDDLLQEGREAVCLYYDNPQAGKIYRRIGFCDVGIYTTLR